MNLANRRLSLTMRTAAMTVVAIFCGATILLAADGGSSGGGGFSNFTVNLWERIESGGPVMIPIGLCSVLVLAFTMERLISLRRGRVAPGGFIDDVEEVIEEEGVVQAMELCDEERHALARVVRSGLDHMHASREETRMVVESTGQREVAYLRKNLRALSVVSAVAPLLGLLGTVGGMIDVFDKYSAATDATDKIRVFSTGISQALVTTFAGLSVSIPAMVIYHFFLARISRFADEVHRAYSQLFESRAGKPRAAVHKVATAEAGS